MRARLDRHIVAIDAWAKPGRRIDVQTHTPAGPDERAEEWQRVGHQVHDAGEGVFQDQARHVALQAAGRVGSHGAAQRAAKQHHLRPEA